MSKQVKKMLSDDLRKSIDGIQDVLVVSVAGIDGIQTNQMRLALREKQIRIQVVKNSLARRVLGDIGLGPAVGFLEGPSALAWGGSSIVELAKEISRWASKVSKLQIKGGSTAGKSLTSDQVTALSRLPSREELLGRVVNLALSPAARLVAQVNAPAGRVASQLKTKAEEAKAEQAAEEPAASAS